MFYKLDTVRIIMLYIPDTINCAIVIVMYIPNTLRNSNHVVFIDKLK